LSDGRRLDRHYRGLVFLAAVIVGIMVATR
jgi:hypothetical protein